MNKFKKIFNFFLVMLVVTISVPLSAFASEEINNITSAKTEENQDSENTDKKSEEAINSSNAETNEENRLNETKDEKTTQDSVENETEVKGGEKAFDFEQPRDRDPMPDLPHSDDAILSMGKTRPENSVAMADQNFTVLRYNTAPISVLSWKDLKSQVESMQAGEFQVFTLPVNMTIEEDFETIEIDNGKHVVIDSIKSKTTVSFGEGKNALSKHLFHVTEGTLDVDNITFVGTLPEGAVAAKNLGTAAPENPNITAAVFSIDGRAKANFYNNIEFKNQKIKLDPLTRCGGFAVVKGGATSNTYGGKFHNLQVDGVGGTYYVGPGFNSTANYFLGEYYDQWNTDGGGPFDNNDADSFCMQRWLGTSVYNNYSKSQGDWYAFAIKGNRGKGENNTEGTQQIYGNTEIYDNYLFDGTSGAITQRSDWGALYNASQADSEYNSFPNAYRIYNPTPNTNVWIGQSQHGNLDEFFNRNPYGGVNGYVVLAEIVYTDPALEQKYANNGVAEGIHGDWEDASNADGTISKTGNYRVVEKQIDGKNFAVLEKVQTEVTVKGVDNSKPQNTLYTDDPILIPSAGKSVVNVKKLEGYMITGAKATGSGIFPETELTPVRDATGAIIGFEIDPNNDKGITIEVQYVASYTIVFDKNQGSRSSEVTGEMNPQEIPVDETVTLTPNKFAREGYTFSGWNTEADGSGESYTDGQEVTNIAAKGEKVVLYAQWTPIPEQPVQPEVKPTTPVQPEVKPTTPVETKPQINVPTGVKVGLSSAIILVIASLSLIVIKRTRK